MATIKVVRIDPIKGPAVVTIENSLEAMQAEIGGGYLEPVKTTVDGERRITWLADEDGRAKGLPPNRSVPGVVGTVLVVGVVDSEEVSLNDDEIEELTGVEKPLLH
jgi:Domain of unknown function (DUF3846)